MAEGKGVDPARDMPTASLNPVTFNQARPAARHLFSGYSKGARD